MRKLFLTLGLILLPTVAMAQVCLTVPETNVRVCLGQVGTPDCETGYPAVTLVAQTTDFSVTLSGTPVCVLRVVPGSQIKGDPLVAVTFKQALATPNGAGQVVTREGMYYASQLSGAFQSSAISVAQ